MRHAYLPTLPTGLTDLDRLTGGGWPGQLWMVGGPAGVKASRLGLSMARATAMLAQQAVVWLSTYEDAGDLVDSVVAAEGSHVRWHLRDPSCEDPRRPSGPTRAKVGRAPLQFSRVATPRLLGVAQGFVAQEAVSLLVLDAVANAYEPAVVADLKQMAEQSATWVVAVVNDDGPGRAKGHEAASALADVVIWVERFDLDDADHPRCGEADLSVSRVGGEDTVYTVAFQERYERFSNIRRHPAYGDF
jgi:hypothetical protein